MVQFIAYFLAAAVVAVIASAAAAATFLTIDASVKEVYEKNINPLLSGAGKPGTKVDAGSMPTGLRLGDDSLVRAGTSGTDTGDFYTILSAAGGVTAGVGVETEASFAAEVVRYQFRKFTDLNATSVGMRTALFKQFSDMNSVQFGLFARVTGYEAHALNGNTYGGTFDLRQQLSTKFWLNEGFVYEKNNANATIFTYTGRSLSVRSGYRITARTSAGAGYTYLVRKFDGGAETKMHSLALGGTWEMAKRTHVIASFERQSYESTPGDANAANSISSIGIAFSY